MLRIRQPKDLIPRVKRILESYRTPGPFSINLANAVVRQSRFIQKMVQLGWTSSDFLTSQSGSEIRNRAIARYHAFFGLMASSPTEPLVPTLVSNVPPRDVKN